ncbi:MAG TPA: hypothetical protein VGC15_13975, partial [Acetobacteraceae bacterium]
MSGPADGPTGGDALPGPARRRASRAGLWGALLGAGAAAAALLALRPAPGEALALQPAGGAALHPQPTPRRGGRPPAGDPNRIGRGDGDWHDNTDHAERQEPSKRIISGYGFWIFLLSDIIMFA